MDVAALPHAWDVTPAAAIGVQQKLRLALKTTIPIPLEHIRLIAGVDVSMTKDNPLLTAGIIIWDRVTAQIIESVSLQTAATFPYVPGLLSFREIPALLQAIQKLKREPDVWMVDGQGIAHPRRLGIATHLGILIDRPTIGVAKSRLTGKFDEPGMEAGSMSALIDKEEQIGVAYRSKLRTNPLFISPGHRIDLPSALAVVQACLRGYRLPEPTRLAHLYVNAVRTGEESLQPTLL